MSRDALARRPAIGAATLAALTESAPRRLVKKLDGSPELALAWEWSGPDAGDADGPWTVTTDRGETVTLHAKAGRVRDASQISCTCLLSPRCLHCLATASALPLDEAEEDGPTVAGSSEETAPIAKSGAPQLDASPLSPEQRAAASLAWDAGTRLLDVGAQAAGALVQAELLRAVHASRASGLFRLGSAGVRLLKDVRARRADQPEFTLALLHEDHSELLSVAARLAFSDHDTTASSQWIGRARRHYATVGSLRLFGLFTEPIVTNSGYAGACTYLCDGDGRLFSVSDVQPGEAARARGAYRGDVAVGDAHVSHRDLARAGLYLQDATASTDGRLGRGKGVRAVVSGVSSWDDDGPRQLWQTLLHAQLTRAYAAVDLPPSQRPAGSDLLFADATVRGADSSGLWLSLDSGADVEYEVLAVVGSEHAALAFRENLELLGRSVDLRVRLVARLRLDEPRTVVPLAIGVAPAPSAPPDEPEPPSPTLRLPDEWARRACVGLERLRGGYISGDKQAPVVLTGAGPSATEQPTDPLDAVLRTLRRVCLGGRTTVEPAASALLRDAARLEGALMPTAAALLRQLAAAVTHANRDVSGQRSRQRRDVLARAWLLLADYERATRRALQQDRWQRKSHA